MPLDTPVERVPALSYGEQQRRSQGWVFSNPLLVRCALGKGPLQPRLIKRSSFQRLNESKRELSRGQETRQEEHE